MLKAGINSTDVIDTQTDVTQTVTKFNFNQFYETTVALRLSNAWACAQVETDSKL